MQSPEDHTADFHINPSHSPSHAVYPSLAQSAPVATIGLPVVNARQPSVIKNVDAVELKRLKTLKDLAPNSPAMKLFTDTIALIIDMFRLAMASLLSVFVPQTCPGAIDAEKEGYFGCTREVIAHDCTFTENFICLTTFNKMVLSWNFICLGVLVFHYFLVWRREKFLIKHFRETLTVGRLNIRDVIHDYPGLERKLVKYNKWVLYISVFSIGLQLVNMVVSGILVMGFYNNGYKSFTTYFTNLLVIGLVLHMCLSAAWIGLKHELAYSCVAIEPISYNSVGPNAVKGR